MSVFCRITRPSQSECAASRTTTLLLGREEANSSIEDAAVVVFGLRS